MSTLHQKIKSTEIVVCDGCGKTIQPGIEYYCNKNDIFCSYCYNRMEKYPEGEPNQKGGEL